MTRALIQQIIQRLHLQPLLGEGGWFRRTGAGALDDAGRPAWTRIMYLLTADATGFSELHRLDAPETYFLYFGDPVEILLLHPDGETERILLGPDVAAGHRLQVHVPANCWQGSRLVPGGDHALLGTTMRPGYWQGGYVRGRRADLLRQYPGQADMISSLTRQ